MTAVGFEPTPLRTGALSQRLRPLGQTVLTPTIPAMLNCGVHAHTYTHTQCRGMLLLDVCLVHTTHRASQPGSQDKEARGHQGGLV